MGPHDRGRQSLLGPVHPPDDRRGRFDLPANRSPVLYLAESAEHAVAEALQPWWSIFWGDWHGAVLFTARLTERLRFAEPKSLTVDADAVRAAAGALGMST